MCFWKAQRNDAVLLLILTPVSDTNTDVELDANFLIWQAQAASVAALGLFSLSIRMNFKFHLLHQREWDILQIEVL